MTAELGLGTVQFGIPYGVTNARGIPSDSEVSAILDCAMRAGIKVVDSAPGYGNAETRLGALKAARHFKLVTKISKLSPVEPKLIAKTITDSVHHSCEQMQSQKLYGVLLHDPMDLDCAATHHIVNALRELRASGIVEKIGISIYTRADAERALKHFVPDIVQCPVNVFDQRLVKDGTLSQLRGKGVEIHLRSIFLQGLLLTKPKTIPAALAPFEGKINAWHGHCASIKKTPLAAALSFIRSLAAPSIAFVGVASSQELQEISAAWAVAGECDLDWKKFGCDDTALIDPRTWSK